VAKDKICNMTRTKMSDQSRIPSLDGIRAVSIAFVLLSHSNLDRNWHVDALGSLGVSVFFVISGFLITTLLVREHNSTGSICLPNFYIRRALRIVPAFYAFLGTVFILNYFDVISVPARCLWSSAFFLRNYLAPVEYYKDWYTAHCWSLSVEEQFYLLWPPMLVALGRKQAGVLAAGLIAVSPLVRVLSYLVAPGLRLEFGYLMHTRIDTLMFGCAGALFWDSAIFRGGIRTMIRLRLPALALLFAAFVSPRLTETFGGKYLLTVGWGLEGACILLVVLWMIEQPRLAAGRLLNHWAVVHVGIISYSVYLWQQLLWSASLPWSAAATFVAAEFSYWLIERPFLRLRGRLQLGSQHRRSETTGQPALLMDCGSRRAEAPTV
jgi:peptidoglycan/LPS O-acetylase OafA/YrhL